MKKHLSRKAAGADFAVGSFGHFLIWGICSSLSVTVCTIVDALLVGNLTGSSGLAVANISTSVFLFYALIGMTVGIGANVGIARLLGTADIKAANRTFSAVLGLGLILSAAALLPLLFKDAFFTFLGVTKELYPKADSYLTVVMYSAPAFIMYHILSASVRSDSDPVLAAIASGTVIFVNIALDIIFMQVLRLGIIGASASLCIAEALGVLVLLSHFFKKSSLLKLKIALPRKSNIKDFVSNGFGVGSSGFFGAVVMLAFNTLLLRFGASNGALYVAIYGVLYTVGTVPGGIFEGISGALSTVTAFTAGESDIAGIFAVRKRAVLTALIVGGVISLLFAAFPNTLVGFFGIKSTAAAAALRIFAISVVFTGINTVLTAYWQSLGRAGAAGVISLLRSCLLMLALGAVLIPKSGITGLALTYAVTEALCTAAVIIFSYTAVAKKYVTDKFGARGRCFESVYAIKTESTEQISADLEGICGEWNIAPRHAFFINFICEEMLLNIIKFALSGGGKTYYISIKLMEKNGDYVLRIRDNVSRYNPFESDGDEIDSGVLRLIKAKTKYCDYQRKMIFNYLYTVL